MCIYQQNHTYLMKNSNYITLNDQFAVDRTKELGRGQYGVVYKGYYQKQKKFIAVKYISALQAKNQKWERELKIMQSVKHQNIMGFYGYLQTIEGVYFFIQYCGGGSLASLISKTGKLSQLKVVELISQIIDAMIHLNQKQILHRDMKPDNILLDQNNNVKVADFGLAREIAQNMTYTGTPLYEAPEVIFKDFYDQKCDVWSVGLILYEMLTGKQYFEQINNIKQLKEALLAIDNGKRPIKYPDMLDPAWLQLTKSMLVFDNEKRPSFKQLAQKFNKIKPALLTRLRKKYGFENEDFDNQDGIRVTQSINPYMKNGQSKLKGFEQQVKEQESYLNLINLRKYLTHFRLKSDILSGLGNLFNSNEYNCIKNVHKYLLLFIANAMYVARIHKHLNELKNMSFRLPDKMFKITDFIPEHQTQVTELLKEFQKKHEASIKKFQSVISKRVNKKILNDYMHRQAQKQEITKISDELGNLLEWIEKSNVGEFAEEEVYLQFYRKLYQRKDIHFSINSIKDKLNMTHKKIYFHIRMIGHIDDLFQDKNYQKDDYIGIMKQTYENLDQKDLLKKILEIN